MIRINLLGEKVDRSGAIVVHSLAAGAASFVAIVVCFFVHSSLSNRIEIVSSQKSLYETQVARLREKTKKVENLEKDKKLLSEKLTTIARLKAKKTGPVHLLDDITLNIPERSWLTGIKQKADGLEFTGIALDPQTVSSFMTKLSSSLWIGGVELSYSKQMIRDDVPVQEFSLLVKLRNALDAAKLKNDGTAKAGSEKPDEKNAAAKAKDA